VIDPDSLHTSLAQTAHKVRTLGDRTWQRVDDWTRTDQVAKDSTRGGGLGSGRSDYSLEEQRLDRQAAAYRSELAAITKRLDADLHRLRTIVDIANPEAPKTIDAGCRSCARHEGMYEPVHVGYYRDACRFCGEWKAAHEGDWPPLAVVRWHHNHPGKKIPLHVVEQASQPAGT
jgi:hypothetical protein